MLAQKGNGFMEEKKLKGLAAVRQTAFICGINAFLVSPWALALMAVLTVVAFIYSLELYYYTLVLAYAIYVALFGKDFLPLMPPFAFCYIVPSIGNNPGTAEGSLFYGTSGLYILVLAAIAVAFVLIRIVTDKNMGLKRLFCQKRALIWGMLALGASYLLSGLGSDHYAEIAKQNFVAAALQFASVFLLYFLFTATVDWEKADKSYFAWFGLFAGYVVLAELIQVAFVNGVFTTGDFRGAEFEVGWGIRNNMGAFMAIMVPFPFYLACKSKRPEIFLVLGTVLALSVCLTASRASMLGAVLSFMVPFWIAFAKCDNKKRYRIASLVMLIIAAVAALVCWDQLANVFSHIPSIFNSESATGYNDNGRFTIYKNGIKAFKEDPIFGQSFFSMAFDPYEHSKVQAFSDFFPPRWHNTTVQILACCGTVGMVAYLFHRYQTVMLFCRKGNLMKTMIGISMLTFIMMSWLDCHFFNLGPTLFYSMALAFAENCKNEDKKAPKIEGQPQPLYGVSVRVVWPPQKQD